MTSMTGKIAVVTGASRGIGKGIALALGERGCTVYVSGRTTGSGDRTIDTTARLVAEAGGAGRAIRCDHGDDADIAALFARVRDEAGHIDYLVNNVYKIPDPPACGGGFWDHPIQIWDDQVGIGLRAHYVASWHAAPLLFAAGPGAAILNVSSPGGTELPLLVLVRGRQGRAGSAHRRHGDRTEAERCGSGRAVSRVGCDRVHPGCCQVQEDGSVEVADAAVRWSCCRCIAAGTGPDDAQRHDPMGRRSGRGVRRRRRARTTPTRVRAAQRDNAMTVGGEAVACRR
jgi:hypothetical protein